MWKLEVVETFKVLDPNPPRTPQSVVHGWKAVDLTFQIVEKICFHPIKP